MIIPNLTPLILVKNDLYWVGYALECIRGYFDRVVIYDIDSQDGTRDVLSYYEKIFKGDGTKVILELFPDAEPRLQVMARNSMIAEAWTDYYMILDGDELWPKSSLDNLSAEFAGFVQSKKMYGIVNRTEVCSDLISAYSPEKFISHHRLYDRRAVWTSKHPGEVARYPQHKGNEFKLSEQVEVFHFHNALRSPLEADVPSRLKRKSQATYHPGLQGPIDLFEKLPILKSPINNFPVNPQLKLLQDAYDPV